MKTFFLTLSLLLAAISLEACSPAGAQSPARNQSITIVKPHSTSKPDWMSKVTSGNIESLTIESSTGSKSLVNKSDKKAGKLYQQVPRLLQSGAPISKGTFTLVNNPETIIVKLKDGETFSLIPILIKIQNGETELPGQSFEVKSANSHIVYLATPASMQIIF